MRCCLFIFLHKQSLLFFDHPSIPRLDLSISAFDDHSLHDVINIISKNVEGFGVNVGVRDEGPEIDCLPISNP